MTTEHVIREPHGTGYTERMNRLRAAVLGANDGIVSVAAVVVGVAGATSSTGAVLTAGAAALLGGALSMAQGEYVSVSSQSDAHRALIAREKQELAEMPEAELTELAEIYAAKGLSLRTARQVAAELTEHDALAAHLDAELHIDQADIVSPWNAAVASALSFVVGAVLPLLAILLPPQEWRIPVTFVAVLAALALTGWLGAALGDTPGRGRAVLRMVLGGALALAATFALGSLLGVSGVV